ncbi:hypothetical protein C7476_11820 [Phyllobacterium bourgognense]|uniref:Uncharacterized protein n=1 Tax=Phyllobacterium bourgognense TaxID=314236 RepID=A0A368YIH9_9HYPH|nr:hypothetical protein C7476_11820 [Phyllobacterium bourgognense]
MVVFEHRSAAYIWYVSLGAQKNAICSPSCRVCIWALRNFARTGRAKPSIFMADVVQAFFAFAEACAAASRAIGTRNGEQET